MVRNWLVKNFVGIYRAKFFGTWTSAVRASRIIFPSFLVFGILLIINYSTLVQTLVIIGCAILIFFGFFYFQLFPPKWEELDDEQKWDFGCFLSTGMQTKKIELTESQKDEWQKLNRYFMEKYKK